jgi:pimeloyl-ACP methyl ester carboxylesterase
VKSLILIEPALQSLMMATGGPVHKLSALMAMLPVVWPMARASTPAAYARAFAGVLGRPGPRTGGFLQSSGLDEAKATRLGCAFLQACMADGPTLLRAAEALRAAKTPVLCITGGWGAMVDKTTTTAARATGGRCAVVKSPNHFPYLENPETFNAVAGAFMHEHD